MAKTHPACASSPAVVLVLVGNSKRWFSVVASSYLAVFQTSRLLCHPRVIVGESVCLCMCETERDICVGGETNE